MMPLLQLVNNIAKLGAITIVAGDIIRKNSIIARQISRYTPISKTASKKRVLRFVSSSLSALSSDGDICSDCGTIVARIVPKQSIDFENNLKPSNRRLENVEFWRQKLNPTGANNPLQYHYIPKETQPQQTEEMVVVLDIDFQTQVFKKPAHVTLHMHRQAAETAQRTLQRMQVSIRRKIQSFRNGKAKVASRDSSGSDHEDTGCYIVLNPSPSAGSVSSIEEGDEELGIDGYIRLPIESNLRSQDLWAQLTNNSNCHVWMDSLLEESDGGINKLHLNSCPPTVLSVQTFENFEADVFVGVPLVIETKVIHADRAVITWFVDGEQVLYNSHCYTPTLADVGKHISVFINPIRHGLKSGYEEVYQYEKMVQNLPPLPILEKRRDWLSQPKNTSSNLRIMSYNLLAELYTTREIDQQVMYNHCKNDYIVKSRRMPLLVYEILAHQPDIICLQEVDLLVFEQLLLPVLKARGYNGYYSNKVSAQLEGCAMFWSLKVFEETAKQHQFALKDLVDSSPPEKVGLEWGSTYPIKVLLEEHPELGRVVRSKVGQILQVAALQLKDIKGKAASLVVGNIHLFYHPMADHIRAIQTYLVCRQLDVIRRLHAPNFKPLPLVLCGDLNSDPLSGALRLLMNRKVEADHFETWKNLYEYSWEKGEDHFLLEHGFIGNEAGDVPVYVHESFCDAQQEISQDELFSTHPPPQISLPACFPELVSGYKSMPEFTNYAVDFSATLDYIFASSNADGIGFEVISSASIPTKQEMEAYVGMPNENMPSDHVSIACDLKWKLFY